MTLKKEDKINIIEGFKLHPKDTGSASVQIALLTQRINMLTEHFKQHRKDFHSRRGLLKLVSQRRKFLEYLKRNDFKKYEDIVNKLNLKK